MNDIEHLFGKSKRMGVFPYALKIASVTLLFKGGDPSYNENFFQKTGVPFFS